MTRSEVAKHFRIGSETLRYYEKILIISGPARNESNYRIYDDKDIQRLSFIIKAKEYGFTLNEIKKIIEKLETDRVSGEEIRSTLEKKLKEIELKISELQKLKELIESLKNAEQLGSCETIKSVIKKS